MKKPTKLIVFLTAIFGLLFGVAAAYFVFIGESESVVFASGSLDLTIQSQADESGEWLPGDIREIEYTVTNTGTMPTELKAYVAGEWDDPSLDPYHAYIQSVDRWSGTAWQPIFNTSTDVYEEFMISPDASQEEYLTVNPNDEIKLRVSMLLNPEIDNEYQNHTYSTVLHLAGRQLHDDATFPDIY